MPQSLTQETAAPEPEALSSLAPRPPVMFSVAGLLGGALIVAGAVVLGRAALLGQASLDHLLARAPWSAWLIALTSASALVTLHGGASLVTIARHPGSTDGSAALLHRLTALASVALTVWLTWAAWRVSPAPGQLRNALFAGLSSTTHSFPAVGTAVMLGFAAVMVELTRAVGAIASALAPRSVLVHRLALGLGVVVAGGAYAAVAFIVVALATGITVAPSSQDAPAIEAVAASGASAHFIFPVTTISRSLALVAS